MLGINLKDRPDEAQAMIARLGLTYPNLVDASAQTAAAYNVRGIPTIAVIDDAGVLRYQAYTLPTLEAIVAMAAGEGRKLAALDGKLADGADVQQALADADASRAAAKKRLAERPAPTSPFVLLGAAVGGLAAVGGIALLLLKRLGGKQKHKKSRG